MSQSVEVQIHLNKFQPRFYQKKMIDALENKGYKKILAIWPRRCLSGDTHILMANGSFKFLKDIEPNDEILSWNGKEFVPDVVINHWKTGIKETYKVSVVGRASLVTSPDHRFLSKTKTSFEWIKASQIDRTRRIGAYSGVRNHCGFFAATSSPYGKEELYDIETQNNHNFVANGYVVHNSGKDITIFNVVIRAALRRVGSYFYCLPTFRQARMVIWDSITIDGKKILEYIPPEIIEKKNVQEMKITLINGSIIQFIGSDTYDTSLVGTNPVMVVFSEYALADDRAYKFVRPILNANDGAVIIASCVAPDTVVLTEDGPRRIDKISPIRTEYSPLNEKVFGLNGFNNAEQFYCGQKQKTLIITLKSGFRIECTPNHPLWSGKEWKRAENWKIGDLIPIQYGQNCFGEGFDISEDFYYETNKSHNEIPFDLNSLDFFYFLGLMHADGCYSNGSICITKKKDPEIINFLHAYNFRTKPDGIHHVFTCKALCLLLECIGFKHGARNKDFPEMLFTCNKEQMKTFLQGIFDGDGTSNSCSSKRGRIKYTTTNKEFAQTLQIMLLNFGIASSIYSEVKEPQGIILRHPNPKASVIYNVEIYDYFAHVFYRDIGFKLKRKQKNWTHVTKRGREGSGNVYPVDLTGMRLPSGMITNRKKVSRRILEKLHEMRPQLPISHYLKEKLYYSPIKEIECSENEVFDFVIPQTHSFFSNGFISHNTPRGHNAFYDLYQIAKNSSEWFCEKLTLDDTKHIDPQQIKNEIHSGEMSEELAQQEYWTNFSLGIEGSYYCRYIDKLRLKGQISPVPYEPSFLVNTAWDLGMRDSTCIVFFQTIGAVVHIIDYYENHSEGLEHYIKILHSKDYTYGKHFAPHDIKVRELGTGLSRKIKASQLGLEFEVVPNVPLMDGIEAVRTVLPKCWIDQENCRKLIKFLENYRKEFDSKRNVYSDRPIHDAASHCADAFRMLALSLPLCEPEVSAEELRKRYNRVMRGNKQDFPAPFQEPRY